MVHAIGEESFVDANANGVYDQGELFQNKPEVFLDNNEDTYLYPCIVPMRGGTHGLAAVYFRSGGNLRRFQ